VSGVAEPESSREHGALAVFAEELRHARTARGLTQDQLGDAIGYSGSLIGMVEACRRVPSPDLARRCDDTLGTSGVLARLQRHARMEPVPAWFRPWAGIEESAAQLRLFEHSLVPGLLQTEDYARAILATRPSSNETEIEELVTARLERQAILSRASPPVNWAVMDEAVLRREVGSAKVMRGQLMHLAEVSAERNVTIEVVPLAAGAHGGLMGAFAIAEAGGHAVAAYLETVHEGYITEAPAALAEICLAFDTLRSDALPRRASRELIEKWAENFDT
jgi:transcriptional regulator with XRE-family HTH domain